MRFKEFLVYFTICTLVFLLSGISGYLAAQTNPTLAQNSLLELRDKFTPLKDADAFHIFGYIFINNTFIDLMLVLTFFLFFLSPLFILSTNGFSIGLVINVIHKEYSSLQIVSLLLPHGILEIPAFLTASAISLWLGKQFFQKIFYRQPFQKKFRLAMKIFFFLVLPLNFFAALIEAYITPLVYSFHSF